MTGNEGLNRAYRAKQDEFYTQLTDMEKAIAAAKELGLEKEARERYNRTMRRKDVFE